MNKEHSHASFKSPYNLSAVAVVTRTGTSLVEGHSDPVYVYRLCVYATVTLQAKRVQRRSVAYSCVLWRCAVRTGAQVRLRWRALPTGASDDASLATSRRPRLLALRATRTARPDYFIKIIFCLQNEIKFYAIETF